MSAGDAKSERHHGRQPVVHCTDAALQPGCLLCCQVTAGQAAAVSRLCQRPSGTYAGFLAGSEVSCGVPGGEEGGGEVDGGRGLEGGVDGGGKRHECVRFGHVSARAVSRCSVCQGGNVLG